MEIESKNGFKTRLQEASESFDFGRELGFNTTDRTVSRRHISFKLHEDPTRVYFQVKGKNPVWVHDSINGEIRVYKTSEGGEMKSGDSFCVSSKNPIWFNFKKIVSQDEDDDDKSKSELRFHDVLAETSGSGTDYDEIDTDDVSDIDPIKEFNFVVMGHEFDCYPKKMIRDIRNWDWFLEESKEKSDDDDDSKRKVKKGTRKRKKGGRKNDDDDDVWTGESEEDTETIKKLKNVQKPKYSTRSKNQKKNKKGTSASTSTKSAKDEEEEEEDDDDDETLGGFIVDDDETRGGEDDEDEDEDEEEEEFEEDEYDDE